LKVIHKLKLIENSLCFLSAVTKWSCDFAANRHFEQLADPTICLTGLGLMTVLH